jgi:hypothetical protein
MYSRRELVDAGGLASYGPDSIADFKRAVVYVDRILKQARQSGQGFGFYRGSQQHRRRCLSELITTTRSKSGIIPPLHE